MPLLYLFPRADVPVLQLSFPLSPGADLFALGRALAPLREDGIAIVGSGSVSHNLAAFGAMRDGPPAWMIEFQAWTKERVLARDVDALCDFRNKAPAQGLNHPDGGEHFRVLLLALGAAHDRVALPIEGSLKGIELS
jgi:4,5-DOPA dioxygenase extradiol